MTRGEVVEDGSLRYLRQRLPESDDLGRLVWLFLVRQNLFDLFFLYGHSVEGRLQQRVNCTGIRQKEKLISSPRILTKLQGPKIKILILKTLWNSIIKPCLIPLLCCSHVHCLPTFLGDGAELLLKFNVVAGALYAVREPGDRRLKVHQLGTQVRIGRVEADGGHAGGQRDLERDEDHREPLSVLCEAQRSSSASEQIADQAVCTVDLDFLVVVVEMYILDYRGRVTPFSVEVSKKKHCVKAHLVFSGKYKLIC